MSYLGKWDHKAAQREAMERHDVAGVLIESARLLVVDQVRIEGSNQLELYAQINRKKDD
jgi:hypothetical protein